jgi:hypothetical protein
VAAVVVTALCASGSMPRRVRVNPCSGLQFVALDLLARTCYPSPENPSWAEAWIVSGFTLEWTSQVKGLRVTDTLRMTDTLRSAKWQRQSERRGLVRCRQCNDGARTGFG